MGSSFMNIMGKGLIGMAMGMGMGMGMGGGDDDDEMFGRRAPKQYVFPSSLIFFLKLHSFHSFTQ